MSPLLVLSPLRLEARAVARGAPGIRVVRTGSGPRRSSRTAARLALDRRVGPLVVAGVGGALVPGVEPGTLVVADRVLDEHGAVTLKLPSAPLLAADLTSRGLACVVGPVVSVRRVAIGAARRAALASTGAVAVDCETAWLLDGTAAPRAVVRAVVDTPERELWSPSTLAGGVRALRALTAAAPSLQSWAAAAGDKTVLLAGPRSFCAGVERAIATVERALDRFGPPIYVRRQIVHNAHVVAGLEARGAVFVRELEEVPAGSTVVLSAHGVAPAVRAEASERGLSVIDATCPLVAKVHREVRRFSQQGYQVVLIGHDGHDETEGTLGEADGVVLVETADDVARLEVSDPERLAYITQTTLAPSDVAGIVAELSNRYPSVVGPPAQDICYATQNRQDALAAIAGECDLVLVVGSSNSSNAARLVEVAARAGRPARLVEDEAALRLGWLAGTSTIGVTAAASTPPELVERVVAALGGLGAVSVEERPLRHENVNFPLPMEVR
ncbi:MAG TPA: 4-hydroxy-3-methylbut-2-enyl diphosphate reductase [Acidimicrobiales bacterium]|nr:4-hydroxy-3-methylbut-2-enyl diphosphate reductase [Acidimicrobiales bacterium]